MSSALDRQEAALALRERGYGYGRIGAALGVSPTTVRRLIKPGFAERNRALALAAKRRRVGTCERCGAATKYAGHGNASGTSRFCVPCGGDYSREIMAAKRGTYGFTRDWLILIGDGIDRFSELRDSLEVSSGYASNTLNRLCAQYGFIERVSRGRYRLTSEGQRVVDAATTSDGRAVAPRA